MDVRSRSQSRENDRDTRNVMSWRVPNEPKFIDQKSNNETPSPRESPKRRKLKDTVAQTRVLETEIPFHLKLWKILFSGVNRSIDELYKHCEEEEDELKCDEAMDLLNRSSRDFFKLKERIEEQRKFENGEIIGGISWEVRKPSVNSPSMTSIQMNEVNKSPNSTSGIAFPFPGKENNSMAENQLPADQSINSKTLTDPEGIRTNNTDPISPARVTRGEPFISPKTGRSVVEVSTETAEGDVTKAYVLDPKLIVNQEAEIKKIHRRTKSDSSTTRETPFVATYGGESHKRPQIKSLTKVQPPPPRQKIQQPQHHHHHHQQQQQQYHQQSKKSPVREDWEVEMQQQVAQASEEIWLEAEAWVDAEAAAEEKEWETLAKSINRFLHWEEGSDDWMEQQGTQPGIAPDGYNPLSSNRDYSSTHFSPVGSHSIENGMNNTWSYPTPPSPSLTFSGELDFPSAFNGAIMNVYHQQQHQHQVPVELSPIKEGMPWPPATPLPTPNTHRSVSPSSSNPGVNSALRSLHSKLSSPDRKPSLSPQELLRRYEERQIHAEILRDQHVADKVQKAMIASTRVRMRGLKEAERLAEAEKQLNGRMLSAEQRHLEYLEEIKGRAGSEIAKVDEVNTLNTAAMAQELQRKLAEVEARVLAANDRRQQILTGITAQQKKKNCRKAKQMSELRLSLEKDKMERWDRLQQRLEAVKERREARFAVMKHTSSTGDMKEDSNKTVDPEQLLRATSASQLLAVREMEKELSEEHSKAGSASVGPLSSHNSDAGNEETGSLQSTALSVELKVERKKMRSREKKQRRRQHRKEHQREKQQQDQEDYSAMQACASLRAEDIDEEEKEVSPLKSVNPASALKVSEKLTSEENLDSENDEMLSTQEELTDSVKWEWMKRAEEVLGLISPLACVREGFKGKEGVDGVAGSTRNKNISSAREAYLESLNTGKTVGSKVNDFSSVQLIIQEKGFVELDKILMSFGSFSLIEREDWDLEVFSLILSKGVNIINNPEVENKISHLLRHNLSNFSSATKSQNLWFCFFLRLILGPEVGLLSSADVLNSVLSTSILSFNSKISSKRGDSEDIYRGTVWDIVLSVLQNESICKNQGFMESGFQTGLPLILADLSLLLLEVKESFWKLHSTDAITNKNDFNMGNNKEEWLSSVEFWLFVVLLSLSSLLHFSCQDEGFRNVQEALAWYLFSSAHLAPLCRGLHRDLLRLRSGAVVEKRDFKLRLASWEFVFAAADHIESLCFYLSKQDSELILLDNLASSVATNEESFYITACVTYDQIIAQNTQQLGASGRKTGQPPEEQRRKKRRQMLVSVIRRCGAAALLVDALTLVLELKAEGTNGRRQLSCSNVPIFLVSTKVVSALLGLARTDVNLVQQIDKDHQNYLVACLMCSTNYLFDIWEKSNQDTSVIEYWKNWHLFSLTPTNGKTIKPCSTSTSSTRPSVEKAIQDILSLCSLSCLQCPELQLMCGTVPTIGSVLTHHTVDSSIVPLIVTLCKLSSKFYKEKRFKHWLIPCLTAMCLDSAINIKFLQGFGKAPYVAKYMEYLTHKNDELRKKLEDKDKSDVLIEKEKIVENMRILYNISHLLPLQMWELANVALSHPTNQLIG